MRSFIWATLIAVAVLMPTVAAGNGLHTSAWLTIDDLNGTWATSTNAGVYGNQTFPVSTGSAFGGHPTCTISTETLSQLGEIDVHYVYADPNSLLSDDHFHKNCNIFTPPGNNEPADSLCGTPSITSTGEEEDFSSPTIADLQFLSPSEGYPAFLLSVDGTAVPETAAYRDVSDQIVSPPHAIPIAESHQQVRSVVAPIPEPSTMILVGSGLASDESGP
jgi:hypothetical protein